MSARQLATVVLALGLLGATASAQSTRYPREPVDKDQEAADKSKLWDKAVNPQRTPYETMLAEARQALDDRKPDQTIAATQKLDEAIALLPDEPDAYQLRGIAFMEQKDWAKCAADFQVAVTKGPRLDAGADRKLASELRRNLGLCQARAGKLNDAERTFADVASTGLGGGEVLMRLGEVRIALGKLDEAIGTLSSAVDATEITQQMNARWLLALAYDRARRPAEAITEARRAAGFDRSFPSLKGAASSALPFLGAGEQEYLLGLAYAYSEPPRSEFALPYFRRFVKLAPQSPWRKRAEDHIREIKPSEFPEVVDHQAGTASFDPEQARTAVRKQMPAMRACAAKTPNIIYQVQIMKVGPRSPPPTVQQRYKPRYLPPPEGVASQIVETIDATPRAETDAVLRCIQPLAENIVMPAIKEKDAYYKAGFFVSGP